MREAIHDYVDRMGELSEREGVRLLRVLAEMAPEIPQRPLAEVEAEIDEIRRARRGGGHLTPID